MIPNLMKTCIVCGSAVDLNTMLGVTLEDELRTKVQVAVCDLCAEDCTPKKAREAYTTKQSQIDEVMARAKELGFDLSVISPTGLVLTRDTTPAPGTQVPANAANLMSVLPVGVTPVLEGEDVVPTAVIDRGSMVSVGGTTRHITGAMETSVPSHASHNIMSLQSKLPADLRQGQARMQMMEGRAGQQIAIPTLRIDKTGVTSIRLVKSDDAQLQQRSKRLVAESGPTEAWKRPSFRDGYRLEQTERRCPICGGQGQLPGNKGTQLCPKCKGSGMVSA